MRPDEREWPDEMHDSILAFVHRVTRKYGLHVLRTLELGSSNVNGSARPFFQGEYVGIDIEDGAGVDRVLSSHELKNAFAPGEFEVVLSTEMLEHDPNPWRTLENISYLLPRGWLILTARGNEFPFHNPPDRFRFLEDGMRSLVEESGFEIIELSADPQVSGWFCLARKGVNNGQ